MGTWSSDILGNDDALDFWDELVRTRSQKKLLEKLRGAFSGYRAFLEAEASGNVITTNSPEEIEEIIVNSRWKYNDPQFQAETEKIMREVLAEPIEWTGEREARFAHLAAYIIACALSGDYSAEHWAEKNAPKLKKAPDQALIEEAVSVLRHVGSNASMCESDATWSTRIESLRQALAQAIT